VRQIRNQEPTDWRKCSSTRKFNNIFLNNSPIKEEVSKGSQDISETGLVERIHKWQSTCVQIPVPQKKKKKRKRKRNFRIETNIEDMKTCGTKLIVQWKKSTEKNVCIRKKASNQEPDCPHKKLRTRLGIGPKPQSTILASAGP
jgi:hypothetical protein